MTAASVHLRVDNVVSGYGQIMAIKGISLHVETGEIVALIGANGAGKSTTLRTVSGLIRPRSGEIWFEDRRIDRVPPHQIVSLGISQAPEGRKIFGRLTVMENLRLGAYQRRSASEIAGDLERVLALFPRLRERTRQDGGTLSGGEQQMLAISRALLVKPRLLLLDEPSFGLAPLIVQEIFHILRRINAEEKDSILVVEQNASLALDLADHAYVLETGRIVVSGTAAEVRQDEAVRRSYLGY